MAIPKKGLLFLVILAVVSFLVFFISSRNLGGPLIIDTRYRVLQFELVKGDQKSEFQYTIPNNPNVQYVDCITPVPTNVLWVLLQRPVLNNPDYRLRWIFTN